MKEIFKKSFDFVTDKVRGVDRYSRTISFTYKDKESFGTLFGGFVSVITYIILLIYSYLMLRITFEKSGTNNNILNSFIISY